MVVARSLLLLALCFLYFERAKAQGTGSVRLYHNGNANPSNTNGLVQVLYGGRWGGICNLYTTSFYLPDVVCHQLGYTGGYSSSVSSDAFSAVIGQVSCSSNYLVILQCTHSTPSSACVPTDNVGVTCYSTRIWSAPYVGMVRLQGGYYAGQGRVEIYCNGQWGSVCYNGFTTSVANTVCTQLGYNDHKTSTTTSLVGNAWLNNVDCLYTQSCLTDCASCPSSSVTCSTSFAANVTCNYDTSISGFGSTRYSCGFDGLTGSVVAGIIFAVLFSIICFFVLVIGIPVCICCCCGIGIGAAAGSAGRTTTTSYSHI